MSIDCAPFLTGIFSHPLVASDISPFVMIPLEHSLAKLAALPSHFKTMCCWATGPQSCRVTSCTQELWLCLITIEIMRVGKGFVLPLRTPIAADRAAGIFSCCPCWRADRRAHRGSDMSQTAGSLIFPIIDLHCFNKDKLCCLLLLWFFI